MVNSFREEVQQEALSALLSVKSGTIDVSMRLGKTLVLIRLASTFNKVLIAYPNKTILQGYLKDSKEFNINISHIVFTTFMSLNKHDLQDYDAVILDEVHSVSLNLWEYIYYNEPKRLFGATGTLPTGDKLKYISRLCNVVYTKTLDDTTNKTSKEYIIYAHMLKPSTIQNIILTSGKKWSESQRIAFFNNKYRKSYNFQDMLMLINAIKNSPTKLNYLKELVKTIDRGLVFLETTKQCDSLDYPSYHTKNNNSEQNLEDFQEGKINILTTINQISAGITFKKLSKVILLHSYASSTKSIQKLGRALNLTNDNVIAEIHFIVLQGTIDETWFKKCIAQLDQLKITYKYIT